MPSPSDIASRIRQKLRLSEPDLDTSIGTPVRKIIDVVSEEIAEASIDSYLLDYQYDIETRSGADLDNFVKLFGFSRLPARRATGQITFERTVAAADSILIPTNTRVATATAPQVVFSTIVPAILSIGETSITVPAQSLSAGTAGNVPADSITLQLSSVQGFTSFSNPLAFTGGVDAESDTALRDRFRKTIFRSLAGTEAMFAGTALEDDAVTQVNVLGSSKTHREQLDVSATTTASTLTGASAVYPGSSFFGTDLDAGSILQEDVAYTISTALPPVVTRVSALLVPNGIYELELQYVPSASRNSLVDNIINRVDLWVKGNRPVEAAESVVFNQGRLFQNDDAAADLYRTNYVRADATHPVAGNIFVPYSFVPLVNPTVSGILTIGGVEYAEGTDFWMVHRTGAMGWSPQSQAGIEMKSAANGLAVQPADNTVFTANYAFNVVPTDVQRAIQRWRLVTSDVWVHQAVPVYLDAHFAVILDPGFSAVAVKAEMFATLSRFIDSVGLNATVQASDLLAVAHSVVGVDAVRFLTSTDDATTYAIQEVNIAGAILQTFATSGRAIDVFTADDEIPVLNDVTLTVKASNSFGTV